MISFKWTLITISLIVGASAHANRKLLKEMPLNVSSGAPLSKMTPKGLDEFESFGSRLRGSDPRFTFRSSDQSQMAILVPSPTGQEGVVQLMESGLDGTVTRRAFAVPKSDLIPEHTGIRKGNFGSFGIERHYPSASGGIEVGQLFVVKTIGKQPTRIQIAEHKNFSGVGLESVIEFDVKTGRRLHVSVENYNAGSNLRFSIGEFVLPDAIEGEIIGFSLSSNTSRLTIQVAKGREITEYYVAVTPGKRERKTAELIFTSIGFKKLGNKLHEYAAQVAQIRGRKTVAPTDGVKGLEVTSGEVIQ